MADSRPSVRQERGVQVVKMPAEFTGSAAYDMEERLLQLARKKPALVLLDMSEVLQITSAAIALLIKLTKTAEEHGGMVALASPSAVVEDVFSITKMKELLHVFQDREEAMRGLLSGSAPVDDLPASAGAAAGRMRGEVVLFEKAGPGNTEATLQAARRRAGELGIKAVVLATTTGATAVKAAEIFADAGVKIIAVTLMAGVWKKYAPPDLALVKQAEEAGVRFLTATHTLMGNVGSAIREKFGGVPEAELIAHAYYTFSQGMKVAVEVATMAADANLIAVENEVIAVAGTGSGADTAIVVRPAYSNHFFRTKIREVLAMPR